MKSGVRGPTRILAAFAALLLSQTSAIARQPPSAADLPEGTPPAEPTLPAPPAPPAKPAHPTPAQTPPPTGDLAERSLEELMDISVVTSSRSEERIDDAPNVMYVITAQQIRRMGYRSILDLFDAIPGFEYSPASTWCTRSSAASRASST